MPNRVSRRALLQYAAVASLAGCDPAAHKPARREPVGPLPPLPETPSTGNVRVSRDGFTTHGEPNIAINPRDARNLLGACIADGMVAAYASTDAGETWISHGALAGSSNGRDPTVTFDAAGRGYICANTDDLHVWRTDDGGRSFAEPVLATRGRKLDHPWLAADPFSATHLFAAWTGPNTNARLEFTGSTDGGNTFGAVQTLDTVSGGQQANLASPMLAAGGAGTIHIVYGLWPPLPVGSLRPEFPAPIRVVSSIDRGQSWIGPVEVGVAAMEVRVARDTNVPALPAVVAHRERPFAAVAFVVRQPGTPTSDIAVSVSQDRGATWKPPRMVPRLGTDTVYTQPQLAVDEAGRLALSAFAHRRGLVDVVLFQAAAYTDRFGAPVVVTSHPFDATRAAAKGKHGAWWIGDYQGLACGGGTVYPFWNDPRTGRLEIFTQPMPAGGGGTPTAGRT